MSKQVVDYNAFNSWDSFGAALMLGIVPAIMNYVFTEPHDVTGSIFIAALALLISLAAVLVLLRMLLPKLQAIWQAFQGVLAQAGLENQLFLPLIKVLAITQVTHIAAEMCRDAGERAMAAKLELCGAATSLLCVIPLAERALALIGALGT